MRDAVIFDIDGTLCDVSTVRHHVTLTETQRFKNFSRFHEDATSCPPHEWVADAARQWAEQGFAVLAVTARSSQWMEHTVWWLLLNDVPFDQLYMRRHGDWRKDVEVKRDLLKMIREDGYRPEFAYDDNPNVIGLWVSEGITVAVVPGWEEAV